MSITTPNMPSEDRTCSQVAFIVKGPPTYMNAEEAWFRFWRKKHGSVLILLVPVGNPHNRIERLNAIIDRSLWDRIEWVFVRSNVSYKKTADGDFIKYRMPFFQKIYTYVLDKIKLDRLARRIGVCDLVFSGHNDVQEHLAAKLNPKELFLLDSGMTVLSRVTSSGYIDYRNNIPRRWQKILKAVGYKIFNRERTTLFCSYAISLQTKHKVVENKHERKQSDASLMSVSKKVFWISTPLVDKYNVPIAAYIDYIRVAVTSAGYDPKDVIYIPHPGKESDLNIKNIVSSLGCDLDDRLIPLEVKLIRRDALPKACISPYSSSLSNLAMFVGDRVKLYSAWHFEFNCFSTLVDWRKEVEKNFNNRIDFIAVNDCMPLCGFENVKNVVGKYRYFSDWCDSLDS